MVIPSSRWFPGTLSERAAWYQNFATQFSDLATGLGFLPADVAAVDSDNITLQALATWTVGVEAYSKAATAFRKEITQGDVGSPAPVLPDSPDFPDITIALPGLYERLDKLVKRIRTAPNYSPEEGQLLGIVPAKSDPIAPELLQPQLKARPMPDNIVEVTFTRGKTDGIAVYTKIDKEENWTSAGTFFKSPASIQIAEGAEQLPRSVQIRARYVEGNSQVGQWSPTVTVSTIP